MKTLDQGTLEANANTTITAQKASFWLVGKESGSKPSKWLIIERVATTSESLGGHTEDWGAGVVWSRKDKSKDKSASASIWKSNLGET